MENRALRSRAAQVTQGAFLARGPLCSWRQPLRGGCREGGQVRAQDDGERVLGVRTVIKMATALKGEGAGRGGQVHPQCSNTPFFPNVSGVFAIFVKNKQNARDILNKGVLDPGPPLVPPPCTLPLRAVAMNTTVQKRALRHPGAPPVPLSLHPRP